MGSFPITIGAPLAPPILQLVNDGVPRTRSRTTADDPAVILLDHVLEEKFEGYRNVRFIAYGLDELLPNNRVCFCVACLLHDAIDGMKQWHVSTEADRVSGGSTGRE